MSDGLTERLVKQHAVIIAEIEAKQDVDEKYFDQLKNQISLRITPTYLVHHDEWEYLLFIPVPFANSG